MNHQECKERLQLSLYGELGTEEQREVDGHLAECSECRAEFEKLKKLHSAFAEHRRLALSNQLLTDARRQLRVALQNELSRPPLWERMIEPIYKISFSGIATLVLGFVIGYVSSSVPQHRSFVQQTEDGFPMVEGGTQITNVQFVDPDASDGEIEFTFNAVRPVRMKGKVDDDRVQKVLAQALLNEKNPGVRLSAVGVLSEQSEAAVGRELRDALINAFTSDPNPGVRKDALAILQKFPFDNEIRDALLYVLKNDQNSGVRIAAINSCEKFKDQDLLKDEDALKVLREKVKNDDNNYIRIMARNVLEEIKQQ